MSRTIVTHFIAIVLVSVINMRLHAQTKYNGFSLGVGYSLGKLTEKNGYSREDLGGIVVGSTFEHYRWNDALTNAFGYKFGASVSSIANGTQADSSFMSLGKTQLGGMIFWRRTHFGLGATIDSYGMSYTRGLNSIWPDFSNKFLYTGAALFIPFGGDTPGQLEFYYKTTGSYGGTILGISLDFKRVISKYTELYGRVEFFDFPQGDHVNPVVSKQVLTEIVLAFIISGTKTK